MDSNQVISICNGFNGTAGSQPFGKNFMVFKVGSKIFAALHLQKNLLELKIETEEMDKYINEYTFVEPAIYSNKKYWISIKFDEFEDDSLLYKWVQKSYQLIIHSLPKAKQLEILNNKN